MYRQFFFNDTATTEIYTLSLHDALPISTKLPLPPPLRNPNIEPSYPSTWDPHFTRIGQRWYVAYVESPSQGGANWDHQIGRATRLNSSHANISYAVFCLKKKINIPTSPI